MLKFKTSCAVLVNLSSNLLNEVGLSLFRYFEVGLRVCDIVVNKYVRYLISWWVLVYRYYRYNQFKLFPLGCTFRTRKVPIQAFGNVQYPILHIKTNSTPQCWFGLTSDILKKSRLNWKLLFFNVGSQTAAVAYMVYPISDIWRCRKCGKYVPCTRRISQGNDFELILRVKMETKHPVEDYFGSEFLSICNYCGVMAAWNRKTWKFVKQFLRFFRINDPLR